MFSPHRPRNFFEATTTTLGLIYDTTVKSLRNAHGNPIIGLLLTFVQALVMAGGFFLMFWVMGIKSSPIRGPYVIYLLTGVFMFMNHTAAIGAVAGAPRASSSMMLHGPMNPAIAIAASALTVLYKQTLIFSVMIYGYHVLVEPVHFENLPAAMGMFMLAWFSGISVGLIFYAATPWAPTPMGLLTTVYQRANMIFSGKLFVANVLSAKMLAMFSWNPLFHITDQTRGFVFINYEPYFTSVSYPLKVSMVLFMIGLMGEFVTRQSISASWGAGK
ncbi:ABC transporter permease [Paracoccus sp. p4-l81]|uniref:ABC transporter permease n=1 Tax=unclassified Paracoccus (in: a-proteobacteria) TaxID=2688777 RepID=UPI0035BA9149